MDLSMLSRVRRRRRTLRRRERRTRARLREHQRRKLQSLRVFASARSPFPRQVLNNCYSDHAQTNARQPSASLAGQVPP